VASDLPVHRAICQDTVTYFPCFSPETSAERVLEVHYSPRLMEQLAQRGFERAQYFRWDTHVQYLLALNQELVEADPRQDWRLQP
jgi:hypothetical protein